MRFIPLLILTAFLLLGCATKTTAPLPPEADIITPERKEALRQTLLAGVRPPQEKETAEIEEIQPPKARTTDALPPQIRNYRTIALLAPFSGHDALLGESLLNASMLSLFENPQVRLDIFSPNTANSVTDAFEQAKQQKVQAIIGPVRAANAAEIAIAAKQYGVPVFSLSNSLNIKGGVIYPTGFAPEGQVPVAMDYLKSQGKMRLAVLAPDNQYGRLVAKQAELYSKNAGFSLQQFLYPTEIKDFNPFIERLAGLRPNAILLAPVRSQNLRIMAAQLDSAYLAAPSVQIVGLQLWDNFGNLQKEPSLDSAVWISGLSPNAELFNQKYKKTFGKAPHPLAPIAYDITSMLIELQDKGRIPRNFTANENYFGSAIRFSPRANGEIIHHYYIKQIKDGAIQSVF